MFIKILKSISSYVYRCSLSLFIAVINGVGFENVRGMTRHSQGLGIDKQLQNLWD